VQDVEAIAKALREALFQLGAVRIEAGGREKREDTPDAGDSIEATQ